ncbi:preferentially expressed antigen in melanoma-like protein 7 [Rattus rattus]|uniref:preferentially expressed antigen in melanoma-like protein 7 n=1 Tax=Rattus rattus TaxID=10117 RepID=UPI0013F2F451|nr:preferentially expressed antigen in melanoma-like protein 7 [Rattus rattus]
MGSDTRPTLLNLASQSLVRNEVLTISVLEYLPSVFFPLLFKEAAMQRKTKMIKILVEYWPYSCLQVGLLINNPNLEIFQTILDGVSTWLKRKYRPRMHTLQLVDLRDGHHSSSDMQVGREGRNHLVETMLEEQVVEGHSRCRRNQRLRVFSDLSFMFPVQEDKRQAQLLQWAKKRRNFLHLCCEKLEIGAMEVSKVRDSLKLLEPEFVKELELNTVANLSKLEKIVPCISKMINLQKLMLVRIFEPRIHTTKEKENVTKIISLFSKLSCLQHLTIDDVYFLTGHMNELFRCLKSPLVSLKITLCQFTQSDLSSFAQPWNYSQLKHLCLKGAILTYLDVFPLNTFLKSVANTLQILELEDCSMNDFQLSILLPTVAQCPQLTCLNLYDNEISVDALKDFLHQTTDLSQLTTEMYPAPVEVYNEFDYVEVESFSQLCAELMDELTAVRKPKSICFGSYPCYDCSTRYIYENEVKLCECHE